jgi:glycosyltransferase involved in cell wall biosynthesis
MFLPTLLECFSASYAEAMKMGLPILTSDLKFAREVCGDAAVYFDPVNAGDIAEKILELYDNPENQARMRARGFRRLKDFGTSQERAARYLEIASIAAGLPAGKRQGLHSVLTLPTLAVPSATANPIS